MLLFMSHLSRYKLLFCGYGARKWNACKRE